MTQGSRHGTVKAQSSWSHLHYGPLDYSSEPKPRDPQLPSLCDGGPGSLISHSIPQPKASGSLRSAGRPQEPSHIGEGCWGHSTAPQPVQPLTTTVKPGDLRARDFRRLVPRALASPPAAWEHWSLLSERCARGRAHCGSTGNKQQAPATGLSKHRFLLFSLAQSQASACQEAHSRLCQRLPGERLSGDWGFCLVLLESFILSFNAS